jgi:FAD/FMN-containing dehydrogenase
MKVIKTGNKTWENRHETFVEDIIDLYELGNEDALDALNSYNDATKGFQDLIKNAIDTQTPLRSLGGGWSWAKIATVNNGIMLDTKPLNTVFDIDANNVSASYPGSPQHLLFAQSGNGIWELGEHLRERNLSLKTSGASNGQTIAGAVSTGTHGSAFDFGATPEFVVGLHLIVGVNRHIWLERASAPVVSDAFIQSLQTELVQDDDLFNAALVNFGSFGIIHGVMIETEDLFLYESYMRRMPYDDSLKAMMRTLDFSNANLPCGNERPYHFSVLLNPYDMDNGAYVTTMYKRPYQPDYQPPVDNAAGIGPGDDAACFMGTITETIPALTPTVVNTVLGASMTLFEKQFGTHSEIFNNTTLRGKLLSAAVGVPITQVNQLADLMLSINQSIGPFTGIFSFRFVKQTTATMGFTRFEHTCVMELDAPFSDSTYSFYTQVWKKLEDEQIPFTFHWGKHNELNPERIARMYGPAADEWIAARNKLLDADSMKVFTNPILQQWGLDKVLV